MSRYFVRRAQTAKPLYVETPLWPDATPALHDLNVSDHEPSFTGLLDARGDMIFRGPNPMGFCTDL